MKSNLSPWISQLKRTRTISKLESDQSTEVAIVGGGIAGVVTAYFLLKNTSKQVLLIEADKIAHGATGHNAGQMTSYFERQISTIAEEFGIELAGHAQFSIDSAWMLLEEIYNDAKLKTPFWQFTGYAGCVDMQEMLVHLKNNKVCSQANINLEPLMIAQESPLASQIPPEYEGLYTLIPHRDILALLETKDSRYIAALSARKGCMNSALFCEELIVYLLTVYADRFTLCEESPIHQVVLYSDHAVLQASNYTITAQRVVLCTNGFEKFTIENTVGVNIDTEFHHLVRGSVGYMAAYVEHHDKSPIAISYLPAAADTGNTAFDSDPYFYLTRRPFESDPQMTHNLICIGGPESLMDDTNDYSKEHPYPGEAQSVIDEFLHTTYAHAPEKEIKYQYQWHGLMGYTPNGVRCIGPEPVNPVLLYNLGCNGVGILPSIYGGKRISRYISGEAVEPSIFDPRDIRKHNA